MGDASWERIGTETDGDPALLHPTAAAWWRLWETQFRHRHPDIPVTIIQALGRARASGGTHSDGWAVDLRSWHLTPAQRRTLIDDLRRWGGAAWHRTRAQGFGSNHIHIAINAGHRTACSHQVDAAHRGRDGLARNGRDTEPSPVRQITAGQAITELRPIVAAITEEESMRPEDRAQLVREIVGGVAAIRCDQWRLDDAIGAAYRATTEARDAARTAASQTRPVTRGGQEVALRQEVADTKSALITQERRLDRLEAKIDRLLDLATPDRAAE